MDAQPPQGPRLQAEPDGGIRGQRGGHLDRDAHVLKYLTSRKRYIHLRDLYVRELVTNGDVEIRYVKTNENIADFFTKFQLVATFRIHRDILMGICPVKRA